MQTRLFFALLFAFTLAAHLCHSGVLWEPETFPLAAAVQMLQGHSLYRTIWYDKPPLSPLLYFALGAHAGWPLRTFGALYTLGCAALAFRFARDLWGRKEAFWAAGLLTFFLTFDFPASVLPIGPDLLTVAPHLGAVWLAWRGKAFWAGVVAAIATLANVKGVFVLMAAAIFAGRAVAQLGLGFAIPCGSAAALMGLTGTWHSCVEQVFIWSSRYAASPFVQNPLANGLLRTGNWLGFHAALLAGSFWRVPWRFVLWIAISALSVALGLRFFPRYYLQLLPPLCLVAAYGAARLPWRAYAVLGLLLIPAIRFAPRYVTVAQAKPWADTALDRDSFQAAALLKRMSRPADTLFIWGYRPELWVYSRLPDATRFLDSQPLTGVPADRHLTQSEPIDRDGPVLARHELANSHPTFIADGLSQYNPRLAIENYPELQRWFSQYQEVGRTAGTVLYARVDTIVR